MNKVEKAKLEKDGLDVFPELYRAARDGWDTLDDDDVMRLKWYGLYPHNTKDGHFMLRTKVVQGVLSADQAEVMAGIADEFGRGIIDCTTRQCFQIHWITLDHVPEIFRRLTRAGLTSSGASPAGSTSSSRRRRRLRSPSTSRRSSATPRRTGRRAARPASSSRSTAWARRPSARSSSSASGASCAAVSRRRR